MRKGVRTLVRPALGKYGRQVITTDKTNADNTNTIPARPIRRRVNSNP